MLLDAWRDRLKEQTPRGAGDYEWPVLIIDEANRLMPWSTNKDYESALVGLLGIFVQISKEENRCHVLMATSEYGFQTWLNTGERGSLEACNGMKMTSCAFDPCVGQHP